MFREFLYFLAIVLLTMASFISSINVSVGEMISILTFNPGQKRHIYYESQLHLHPPLLKLNIRRNRTKDLEELLMVLTVLHSNCTSGSSNEPG